jgi:hypothetical protein
VTPPERAGALVLIALLVGCGVAPEVTRPPSGLSVAPPVSSAAAVRPSSTSRPPDPTPPAVACPEPAAAPTPMDPLGRPAVAALIGLFDRYPIVALGERHGWQAEHDFLAQVICDPRFPDAVDAIVVEFGNRRLQPILDRYVSGDRVTIVELASVWRESTQRSGVWEHPVYARFFGLIRTINEHLPTDDRIRVLAGDPAIDYTTVTQFSECSERDPACYEYWLQRRDESFADVVATQVLPRGQRALLIAGSGHMIRRLDGDRPSAIPQLIEDEAPGSVFTVVPGEGFGDRAAEVDETLRGWPVPALATLRGTALGALDACLLDEPSSGPDAPPCPSDGEPRVEDVVDGYLLLSPIA